jgi:hypothetical protein
MAKGQMVVVYGHFGASALPDTVTRMLAADGLSVAHLTVGWNEFAHMSALWMPEELWRVLRIDQLVVRKED